ncbi:sporulation associated protein [Colletotrichum plurivorum]|uniref:Sporulation associated protein n=1 Tax=Colletotrichum plurivorum TaxID=2175906 RepID=A0A8H6K2E1_9PEZI|nr:sporulation associated protein [Colletotrichum plurivorum]
MDPKLSNGDHAPSTPKKLVLCFDGTGNTFTGSNADTNVVKILSQLDRNAPNQFHYYQTGIGTYDINDESVNKSWFGELRSSISQTIDQGIGMTFDAHVLAGYRFLMRYYNSGDKIYIFGFSRGAFTAKFLARMIHTVGLLCKGNEEMVPFAYKLYQRYLAGEVEEFIVAHPKKGKKDKKKKKDKNGAANGDNTDAAPVPEDNGASLHDESVVDDETRKHKHEVALNEITAFSDTFCRKESVMHCGKLEETNIKVFFLGMWDCVNSVAVLERKTPVPVPVAGTAHHVRHAVAVDERRVKFKAALLAQDIRDTDADADHSHEEDIKEVWFPGCHGDVGGGWPASDDNPLDASDGREIVWTVWQRVKNLFTTRKSKEPSKALGHDRFQMSDIPLAWMIREVELVGEQDPSAALKWRENANEFKARFKKKRQHEQALRGFIHDSLAYGCGTGFFKVLLWKFMEWLPIITRWELEDSGWKNVRFPLNGGATRDIPRDAVLHDSLIWRLENDKTYCPGNNHGGRLPPCLKHNESIAEYQTAAGPDVDEDPGHKTWKISTAAHDLKPQGGPSRQ